MKWGGRNLDMVSSQKSGPNYEKIINDKSNVKHQNKDWNKVFTKTVITCVYDVWKFRIEKILTIL